MKSCCVGCETPYCPQCGTKQPTSPLTSLLTFLRQNEQKTMHRVRKLKWGVWADAVEEQLRKEIDS